MKIFAVHKYHLAQAQACYLYKVTSRRQKTDGYGEMERLSTETVAWYKILTLEVIGIIKLFCIYLKHRYSVCRTKHLKNNPPDFLFI